MSVHTLTGPRLWAPLCKCAFAAIAIQLSWLPPASATSCLPLLERAPPLELELFTKDPSRVLDYALSDDDKLEDKVTVYLSTNPEVTTAIKELLIKTPSPRHYAIGRALGRSALHCGAIEPAYTRKIFTFVSTLRDSDVLAGYSSVEASNGVQLGTIGNAAPKGTGAAALLTGEFGTELANPFSEPLLPQ
jgi:hypothetical protein